MFWGARSSDVTTKCVMVYVYVCICSWALLLMESSTWDQMDLRCHKCRRGMQHSPVRLRLRALARSTVVCLLAAACAYTAVATKSRKQHGA